MSVRYDSDRTRGTIRGRREIAWGLRRIISRAREINSGPRQIVSRRGDIIFGLREIIFGLSGRSGLLQQQVVALINPNE
jgi:hypothetical protein